MEPASTMPCETAQSEHYWCVRVSPRTRELDGRGRDVLAEIHQIGFPHIAAVHASRLFLFSGSVDETHIRLIAEKLLTDRVTETYRWDRGLSHRPLGDPTIEVHTLPGVMNPLAMSTLDAARRLLDAEGDAVPLQGDTAPLQGVQHATIDGLKTACRYEIIGARGITELEQIASGVLANSCIETWYLNGFGRSDPIPDSFARPPEHPFTLRHVAIERHSDDELTALSRQAHLFLSVEEMRTIRDHFARLGRPPTDLELETLAQTWSEHCVHKTLTSELIYHGAGFGQRVPLQGSCVPVRIHFDNLLKQTIVAATVELDRDWCLSVFVDNAGVIAFDDEYGLAFKVETHNHPSAIEPYGGAATGIGGCIRDIMGCGLGAKPIASTDVFCVAPPDFEANRLPKDVLHPRRVLKGVVSGVRDYGNRMGIPTVGGAIQFDERYLANPLVFCGCIGLIPRDRIHKGPQTGDYIVLAGGRTGRDGIHGATFSSAEFSENHAEEFSHAVQIGHAIEEKKLLDALLLARDHSTGPLFTSVTDCGAGGLSSAVGEMGEKLGARVSLDKVPLKYSGLRYDEIWISEAQERMVFAVPQDRLNTFLQVFADEDVEAGVIGRFTDDHCLRVDYQGNTVGELDMAFLHHGRPKPVLNATWFPPPRPADRSADDTGHKLSLNDRLLKALGAYNTASKEWVIRQYDHEVQGRSVIKPLVGPGFGPSDAAVLRPRYNSDRGMAVGCGLGSETDQVDPYLMAIAAVDEALRNVICVGANVDRTAILDNFCWPKVDHAESLGALVRACRGAADAAVAFGLPFISGKDSLNNEFSMTAEEARRTGLREQWGIPYTLLISAISVVDDVRRCVSMDLKAPGNRLVLASAPAVPSPAQQGLPDDHRAEASTVPHLEAAFDVHRRVSEWIRTGNVFAAHDVSDGGLAVTIAEMCIAGGIGASIVLSGDDYAHSIFTSVATTYVLEMSEENAMESGLTIIGVVEASPRLRISLTGDESIDLAVADLAQAWRSPLADGGGR